MATQVSNYQCPACGGPLHFDGTTGKLECDYCGSSFDPAEIEKYYAEKDARAAAAKKEADEKQTDNQEWDYSELSDDWGNESEGMKVYNCPSCGAELICDASTAATSCPYCGNPTIIPGQFAGGLKPDYVIPFKIAKEQAEQGLKKHYKGKPFLPGAFTNSNHVEKIQGVYVPFWMFDGEAEGNAVYDATKTRVYTRDDIETTETQHFSVYRSGTLQFEKVPVDGSSKMNDDYMDSIEPFDYSELKPFSTAYMPGYLADKYDVSAQDSEKRADTRCENSLMSELRATIAGYSTCVPVSKNIHIKPGKVHYALLPVWVLNTKWNGKDYMFMMNGQTGKMIGDLPTSKAKMWGTFAGITAVLTGVISLLYFL